MRDFQTGVRELRETRGTLDEKTGTFVRLVSGFLGRCPVSLFLFDAENAGFTLRASTSAWRCQQGEVWFDAAATIDALALDEERIVHLAEPEAIPGDGKLRAEQYVFPLVAHEERAGVLVVERVAAARITDGRRQVLAEAVRQFAELLVQETRLGRLSSKLTRVASLQEVGITLLASESVGELLRSTAFAGAFVLEAEASVVRLLGPGDRRVGLIETHGLEEGHFRERVLALEEQAVATALRGGAPLLVRDVGRDSRFAGFADAVHDFVCQPVGGREGHAGAVTVVNKLPANGGAHRGALAEEDRELLGQLARYFHGAARQALRLAAKERARGFDAVTGLLSPRAFRELVAAEVRRATRFGTRFLLLACDVTPVAPAGAGVAVPQGREFFRTLGRRLRGAFREYDHVARVGPARFVVLLPEVRDGMTSATRRIEGAVGQERDRLRRLGRELQVEISFSQALFPDDGTTYEALALFLGLGSGKAR